MARHDCVTRTVGGEARDASGETYATWADPITGQVWDRKYRHEDEGWSLSLDYDIGEDTTMRIIAANRSYLSDWTSDSDFSPFEITTTKNLQDHDQDTLELQFNGTAAGGRLEWTAGAFYYDARSFLGGRAPRRRSRMQLNHGGRWGYHRR